MSATTSDVTGQPSVKISHPSGASAEIHTHGATVTSYKTAEGAEVLFVSEKAIFNGAKAIRGGIPLVFPQFGQPNPAMPSHGVARTTAWELGESSTSDGGDPTVNFLLKDTENSRSKFPHVFSVRYEVTLSKASLTTTMHITNPGEEPYNFQALLHTYLRVPEVANLKVVGFQGISYKDQVMNNLESVDEREEATIEKEVDRVYSGAIPDISVVGCTTVHKSCIKKTASGERLADFGDEEFHNMVCVEPGLVSKSYSILPGETYSLTQVLTPAP